jgi:hypothetical protein
VIQPLTECLRCSIQEGRLIVGILFIPFYDMFVEQIKQKQRIRATYMCLEITTIKLVLVIQYY